MKRYLLASSLVLALSTALFAADANATDANVTDVAATAEAATSSASPELLAQGEKVFKKCIACHGAKAEKSYLNKVPVLTTLDAETMVTDMKAYKAGEIEGGKGRFGLGGVMKGQMASLSEDDMKAVAEYITTLK
ncbi:MAG: c-type cytochrome [Campylobacter sp.]|nr:c-type cytochrome [Campylobacter sp.]